MIQDISSSLETRLSSLSGNLDIAWPNISFTPKVGVMYLRATNIRGGADIRTLSYDETLDGIFQVDVVFPKGSGRADAEQVVDNIRTHFAAVRLIDNVEIQDIVPGPMQYENEWVFIPVSINYRVLQ